MRNSTRPVRTNTPQTWNYNSMLSALLIKHSVGNPVLTTSRRWHPPSSTVLCWVRSFFRSALCSLHLGQHLFRDLVPRCPVFCLSKASNFLKSSPRCILESFSLYEHVSLPKDFHLPDEDLPSPASIPDCRPMRFTIRLGDSWEFRTQREEALRSQNTSTISAGTT